MIVETLVVQVPITLHFMMTLLFHLSQYIRISEVLLSCEVRARTLVPVDTLFRRIRHMRLPFHGFR